MAVVKVFLLLLLCGVVVWSPDRVHAAQTNIAAGFVPSTLWLSQSAPKAGNAIRISTVLYNSSTSALEGSVNFSVDGAAVGAVPFSLNAGESTIASLVWTATEGSHTFGAAISNMLDKETGAVAVSEQTATAPITVSVLPPEPKSPTLQALDAAQSVAASSSPLIASIISNAAHTTEAIRQAGESYLSSIVQTDNRPRESTLTTKSTGAVLGTSTQVTQSDPALDTRHLRAGMARGLLPLFRYPALFYPVFLCLTLFALWLLARKFRNPKRR